MKQRAFLFLFVSFMMVGTLGVPHLFAQSAEKNSTESAESTESAKIEPGNTSAEKLEKETQTYLQLLDEYRTQENKFSVAKQQYQQLKTLASLEEAAKVSKVVQMQRMKTLQSYYSLLELLIDSTDGIDLAQKTIEQKNLKRSKSILNNIQTMLEESNDYTALDQANAALLEKQELLVSDAYEALLIIKSARIQSSIDRLQTFVNKVYAETDQTPEKVRAFEELVNTLNDTQASLDKTTKKLTSEAVDEYFSLTSYNQYVDQFNESYIALRQAVSYAEEFIQ